MAPSFATLISTALLGAAGALGVVALRSAVAQADAPAGDIQFVRCAGASEAFAHTPHPAQPAQPVWALRRAPSDAPASCGGDGNTAPAPGTGPVEPEWLERRPGVIGMPRLLV